MSKQSLTVAIAGGKKASCIGTHVTKAFLHPSVYSSQISRVLILTRNPQSEKAKEFEKLGGTLVKLGDRVTPDNLKGVEVVVNCFGHGVGAEERLALFESALGSGAKVYFPTEYGIDHSVKEAQHVIWQGKREHAKAVREASAGKVKVIQLYTGHFMEDALGPWFGIDTKNHHYTSIGPATTRFTMTSKDDIGRALVQLAIIASFDSAAVADHIRINGDTKSYQEIADIMAAESGENIQVSEEDVEGFKVNMDKEGMDPASFLRVLNSNGAVDYSLGNMNELVNPKESLWKWKTVEEYAKEVKGRPWCD